ncbi:MAG: hypothetical protein V3S89_12385 [Desulfobacterales bacterium]
MKDDDDMELYRLFDEIRVPPQDEVFVEKVTRQIARHRLIHRATLILVLAGAAVLAALTPWLTVLTGYVATGTKLFIPDLMTVILSPIGCSIGGGMGLFLFLRARS